MPAVASTAFAWRVDEVVAKGLVGEFRDAMASPERQFAATVATFEIKNLASTGGKDDAATLKLELAVKDIAEQVRIEGGGHFLQEDRGEQIATAILEWKAPASS